MGLYVPIGGLDRLKSRCRASRGPDRPPYPDTGVSTFWAMLGYGMCAPKGIEARRRRRALESIPAARDRALAPHAHPFNVSCCDRDDYEPAGQPFGGQIVRGRASWAAILAPSRIVLRLDRPGVVTALSVRTGTWAFVPFTWPNAASSFPRHDYQYCQY